MFIKNKIIFLFIGAILSILSVYFKSILLYAVFVLVLLFCIKRYGKEVSLCMILFFAFFQIYKLNKKPSIDTIRTEDIYVIEDVKKNYIIVTNNKIFYLVYIEENTYTLKDELLIVGNIVEIQKDLDLYVFEFKDYLNSKRVYYQIDNANISILAHNQPFSTKVVDFLTSHLENESYVMTKMLLLNDKNANIDLYETLKEINAVHLFVVSGFHISFFFTLLCKLFAFKKDKAYIPSLLICGFYVYLLRFSISSFRAYFCLLLIHVSKKNIKALDCLAITGIITLLFEPMNILNYSFILSYLLAFLLILSSTLLQKVKKSYKPIMISFLCTMSLLPILLNMNYQMNFVSFFSNLILSPVVIILFVLVMLGLPLSLFNGDLFSFIYKEFNKGVEFIDLKTKGLLFGHLNPYITVIYYVLLFLTFMWIERQQVRKFILCFTSLICLLAGVYFKGYLLYYQQVTFLNVYQGDCTIIQDQFTNKVMLVDTGGLKNYDVASKKIMPYLNYMGIKKIDLVVVTHHDYDHEGALNSLKKQIRILNIIDDVATCTQITLGNLSFKNLNQYYSQYEDENNQSIVLYGKVCGYQLLLTGDIDERLEANILEDNPNLQVDILKVAHHGSKNSTSSLFLNTIKPQYGIISAGENNFYGHPHEETLNRLDEVNVLIYRTDLQGSIKISFNIMDLYFIETAK